MPIIVSENENPSVKASGGTVVLRNRDPPFDTVRVKLPFARAHRSSPSQIRFLPAGVVVEKHHHDPAVYPVSYNLEEKISAL